MLGSYISSYEQDSVNDILTVLLKARIVDYVSDDRTGEVVKGSDTAEKFMTYEWPLIRRKGVQTKADAGVKTLICPNCGAPLSVNQSGKCEYCGNIVTSGDYNWVVSSMRGLSQRTEEK